LPKIRHAHQLAELNQGYKEGIDSVVANGKKLFDKIFERNRDYGGFTGMFVGSPGSGKTSAMLTIMDTTLNKYPEEVVIWNEPDSIPIQFLHSNAPCQILIDRSYPLQLYEIPAAGGKIKPSNKYKIRYFDGPGRCLKMCKPGIINAVYFSPNNRFAWLNLLNKLRFNYSWQNVFLDEAENLLTANLSGSEWRQAWGFSDTFKELRKSRCNLYMNSQQLYDIDFRAKGKINLVGYFRGAKTDIYSPVWPKAVQKLQPGTCYLCLDRAEFGLVPFLEYKPKNIEYVLKPKE